MQQLASVVPMIRMRGLIDRSGSMEAWYKSVVDGVNAYLQTLKNDGRGKDADSRIVTFDSMGFDTIRNGTIADVELIEPDEIEPRALTPLYDATASALTDNVDESAGVRNVLWIFTDGEENASKNYQKTADIRALVEDKIARGWLIIYLGANIDAWKTAEEMGIQPQNVMNVHVQGTNQQPAQGRLARLFGGKSNPVGMALIAAAGLGLAYALLKPGDAQASQLGFTDADRNAAMGVDGVSKTWEQARDEDIANFNEPFKDIFDLPSDLHQQVANLPADFDPAMGSMNADGTQSGGFNAEGDVLNQDDAQSLASDDTDGDDDEDDDGDDDDDIDSGDGDSDSSSLLDGDGDSDGGILDSVADGISGAGEAVGEAIGGLFGD